MAFSPEAYGAARSLIEQTMAGAGAIKGQDGAPGKSAYEIAKDNGFDGTEQEWLESLVGEEGKSAYEVAKDNGFEGTEEEWLQSLTMEKTLSLAEYEALSDEEKNNGVTYYIEDSEFDDELPSDFKAYVDTEVAGAKTYADEEIAEVKAHVDEEVDRFSGEIAEITTYDVGNNKIIYDTFVVVGNVGATRNLDADVYLENGKTYNLRMYEKAITSSQIKIQNKATKEDIKVIVNFEAVKTTGIDFAWNYDSGCYNYRQLTGSANSIPSQSMIDSLIISEKEKGLIEWEKGEVSLITKKALIAKNSALLNGYNVNEIVEMAKTDSLFYNVSLVGDSLIQGAGAPAYNIANQLNNHFLDGQVAFRFGVGGESSTKIAMRQGGLPTYVMPVTIPSDVVAVEIQITDSMGNVVQFGNLNGLLFGVETCYIQGIKGSLSISDDKKHTYFTRAESGNSVVIDRPTLFVSEIAHDHLNDVFVFWCGTNDGMTNNGTAKTMSVIDDMIGLLPHNRYIVVGMTSEQYMPNIDDINNEFMLHFGNHFFNVRKYLEDYGLLDNGLSDDSNTTYNDSAIPDALYADGTHFNQYGYYSGAKGIYLFGKDKGYFA